MTFIKKKVTLLFLGLLLLNSCIVKSLFPFFTKDTVQFEKLFLGVWQDSKEDNNQWIISSVKDISAIEKAKKTNPDSAEDLEFYDNYKNGYYAAYQEEKENRTSIFLVVPFKLKNQLFLDFTPLIDDKNMNSLVSYHIAPTHSLAKFDISNNNNVSIKWLSSEKVENLITSDKIRIKHEKLSPNNEHILTAPSDELQKFITKFMVSGDKNKWETDVEFNLKRTQSKEAALELMSNKFDFK